MYKNIFIFDHKIEKQPIEQNDLSIDPKTGFVIGSQEYNDYYFPKIEKQPIFIFDHKIEKQPIEQNDLSIDPKTGFVIGSQEYNDYYFPKIEKTGRHR